MLAECEGKNVTMDSTAPSRLERILRLLSYLQTGPSYNAQELADALRVHRRTVFRDLNVLRKAGVVIRFDEDTEGYAIPPQHSRDRVPRLSEDELVFLLASVQLSPLESVAELRDTAHQSIAKLLATLPQESRLEICRLMNSFSTDYAEAIADPQVAPTMKVVFLAIRKRQQLRMVIKQNNGQDWLQTKFAPYRISFNGGRWEVIGRSSVHMATCTFDIQNIVRVELTEDTYAVPRGFRSHQ
jgi:predicted DNA-binding transcriptional regulator YafY